MSKSSILYWIDTMKYAIEKMEKEKSKIKQNREEIKYFAGLARMYLKYVEKELEETLKDK